MASKTFDEIKAECNREIVRHRAKIQEAKRENARLFSEIGMLKDAKGHAENAKQHSKSGEKRLKKMLPMSDSWRGKRSDEVMAALTWDLSGGMTSCTSQIDSYISYLKAEISKRQKKINGLVAAISSLENLVTAANHKIRDAKRKFESDQGSMGGR